MPHSRQRVNLIVNELFQIFLRAPIWVGPVFAGFAFVLMRWCIPWLLRTIVEENPVANLMTQALAPASMILAPWAAGGVALLWVIAQMRRWLDGRLLIRQSGIDSIRILDWHEFERLLGEAFRRQGYQVEHIGRAGPDGGVDLHLKKGSETTLVQCKQWRAFKVGVKVVRELCGVMTSHAASSGIVVTSGDFTPDALVFAETVPIQLINGAALVNMIGDIKGATSPESLSQRVESAASTAPTCPVCAALMIKKTAKRGANVGSVFWGCSRFPICRGTLSIDD